MKLLYGIGNYACGKIQMERFLKEFGGEVKIAGFMKSVDGADWILDGVRKKGKKGKDKNLFDIIIEEIDGWKPDLIISDKNFIITDIGKKLGIETWNCSGANLIDGIIEFKKGKRYKFPLRKYVEMNYDRMGNRNLICSAWGEYADDIKLRKGYEWVRPYFEIDSEKIKMVNKDRKMEISRIMKMAGVGEGWYLCGGEGGYMADGMYGGRSVNVVVDFNEPESMANGILVRMKGIGNDFGYLEKMERYAADEVEKTIDIGGGNDYMMDKGMRTLGEMVGCN